MEPGVPQHALSPHKRRQHTPAQRRETRADCSQSGALPCHSRRASHSPAVLDKAQGQHHDRTQTHNKTAQAANQRMRKTLLSVLLACSCNTIASAQSVPTDKTISVGYYEFQPYSWTDENGQPQGSILDLTERLLRHAGYQGEYRSLPGARLYMELKNGSVQLWPGAGGKSELAGHTYEARHSLGNFNLVLFRREGEPPPKIPTDLRGRSVITISGYSYWKPVNDMLAAHHLGVTRHRTSTHIAALEMLHRNRGDFLLDYQAPVEQARQKLNLPELPYTVLQDIQLRLIASRHASGSQRLIDELDKAYEELNATGELLQLNAKSPEL